jgi:hypothetical protein
MENNQQNLGLKHDSGHSENICSQFTAEVKEQ